MTPNTKNINLTLLACALLSTSSLAFSGQIYVYQNKNGETLLTNRKNNDQSLKTVKVTYYPESNIHTYKDWGKNEAAVPSSSSKSQNSYDHFIHQAAQTHGISAGLIKAVIHTESGFNLHARSPVGAQGLMQLMPATAKRFNVNNVYDPQQNIAGGAKYLSWLLKRFNGNTSLALAAYNAGEGNVSKYGGIPPFRETQDYVRRVTSRLNNLYAQGVKVDTAAQYNHSKSTQNLIQSSDSNSSQTVQYAQRPIVVAGEGSFTDTASGSYSTTHATATAQIYIEPSAR